MATKAPPTRGTTTTSPVGQADRPPEFWKIGDIAFVDRIQRDPTPPDKHGDPSQRRMNALGPFDPTSAACCAARILTDGEDAGAKVLTDGLGRKTRCAIDFGPDVHPPRVGAAR